MDALKQSRSHLKGAITRIYNFASSISSDTTFDVVEVRVERLEEVWQKFCANHIELHPYCQDEDGGDQEMEFESVELKFLTAKATLRKFLRESQPVRDISDMETSSTQQASSALIEHLEKCGIRPGTKASSDIELPAIKLAPFSGDYREWPGFRDMFLGSIDCKSNLTSAQKLRYLKSFLRDDAAKLLNHVPISDGNYAQAWERLERRYNRPVYIINAYIEGYLKLPSMTNADGVHLRRLLDGADEAIRGLAAMKAEDEKNDSDTENEADNANYIDDEERGDDGVVEKMFKFEDFVKRLLHPKIIRACSIVLVDWEKIPTKSLKSAVTILHRIAYGCSSPAMLYQAVLFKVFQEVFEAPRDPHSEELRRLGTYIIRKFVETAPKNPKIYAELFFYKTIRDANEIETGYCDVYEAGTKGTWTEEQENELRFLFEENQRNPQTDQDVIDWILENLIDKTRTRRGVLKKLRELGLQFKAPTKKSSAAASNKNLWHAEEDDELKALYDEHRLEDNCLQRILDAFGERRSKNHIIKRMIQLHLIADKSEILPVKPKKRKSKKKNDADEVDVVDEGNDQSEHGKSKPPKKSKTKKQQRKKRFRTPLDINTVQLLVKNIDEEFKTAMEWVKESLEDAAEDPEEAPVEDDGGVPLLPLTDNQIDALDNNGFQKLLLALGVQPPIAEMEQYWRIPTYLTAADLLLRVRILNGEEVDNNEVPETGVEGDDDDDDEEQATQIDRDEESGEESEEDYLDTFMNKRREQMNNLLFSKSDDEDEQRAPLVAKGRLARKSPTESDADRSHADKQKTSEVSLFDIVKGDGSNTEATKEANVDELDFNSEDYRKRLAELESTDSDSDNNEEETTITNDNPTTTASTSTTHGVNRTRVRVNRIDSDSDEDGNDSAKNVNGTRKRVRSSDNEGDDNRDAMPSLYVSNEDDDEDEQFLKRKKLPTAKTKLGEEPKRRRIAIIDDDEDAADF